MTKFQFQMFLAFALASVLGWAAVTTAPNFSYQPPNKFTAKWETAPQLVPASTTDPFTTPTASSGTSWGDFGSFTNVGSSACLLEIYDKQSTPVVVIKALIPPYDPDTPQANNYVINWGGRVFPSGVTWKACNGTSIAGYMRIMK